MNAIQGNALTQSLQAPGSRALAERVVNAVSDVNVQTDEKEWGLDHGTWSVLRRIFGETNDKPMDWAFGLGT